MRRRDRYARARQASLKEDGARDTSSKGEIRLLRLVVVCGILVVTGLLGGFVHRVMPTGPVVSAQEKAKSHAQAQAQVAASARRRREAQAQADAQTKADAQAQGQPQTMSG